MSNIASIIGAAMNDWASIFKISGVGVPVAAVQGLIANYMERRLRYAGEILLDEFKNGNITSIDVASEDDFGGILFRYFNAIKENSARLNLRLMAQVMVGQAKQDKLFVDDFYEFVHPLSLLTRKEVIAVSAVHKYTQCVGIDGNKPAAMQDPCADEMISRLIPLSFEDEDDLYSTCSSASRSGLIVLNFDMNYFRHASTPLMNKLAQVSDFDAALSKESMSDSKRTQKL